MLDGGDRAHRRSHRAVRWHRPPHAYFYLWEKQKHAEVPSLQRIAVGAAQRGLIVGPSLWLNWALAQSQGQQKMGQLPKAVGPSILARPDHSAAGCAVPTCAGRGRLAGPGAEQHDRPGLASFSAVRISLKAGRSACH